ncbi:MAG: hypothetical protein IGS50_15680 [Synechococcales cyanobacterium C42_A2020_086]|nr:hypothetical protein [Synechococcales cyanobacterium C42_A2020_086]
MGHSARMLGVRLSIDVDVVEMPRDWLDDQGYLRPEAAPIYGGDGHGCPPTVSPDLKDKPNALFVLT